MYDRNVIDEILQKFYLAHAQDNNIRLLSQTFTNTLSPVEKQNLDNYHEARMQVYEQKFKNGEFSNDLNIPLHDLPNWDDEDKD